MFVFFFSFFIVERSSITSRVIDRSIDATSERRNVNERALYYIQKYRGGLVFFFHEKWLEKQDFDKNHSNVSFFCFFYRYRSSLPAKN